MELAGDRRGQSIQIGAILLFGALIIAFASYQAFVVPNQNREVEFNHNQGVQSDMQDLRNAIVSVGGSDDARSVTVQLGTRYPSRLAARNPGPPSGSLDTVGTTDDRVDLTIENVQASGETGDFWNESQRYNTGGITYSPNYNVYTNPPDTVYEQSVLYNRFPTGNITVSNQSIIDGTDISLVVLNGSVSRSSTEATSVDVRSVSSSTERVRLENDSTGPINITFASTRSAAYWDFLEETQSKSVASVTNASDGNGFYNVSVELRQNRTYSVQLTKIGVGDGVTGEDVAYLTDTGGDGATVSQGETTELTLEVRDRFNNPPDDAAELQVNGSVVGSGSFESTSSGQASKTPGQDGRVTFVYEAPSGATGTQEIEFSYTDSGTGLNTSTPQNVSMSVDVQSSGGGGGGDGGSGTAGSGGESTYSGSGDTETVTNANGRWESISYIDQIRYSNLGTVILDPNGNQDVRYETGLTIRNETEGGADYGLFFKLLGSPTQPSNGDVTVHLAEVTANGNQYDFSSTPSANLRTSATARLFNETAYNGTNVLDPSSYKQAEEGSTFRQVMDGIRQSDNTNTTVIISESTGRANITLRDQTLVTAVEPDPASISAEDGGEFFALHFRTPVDTTGWTVENESASMGLPAEEFSGTVYFAKNTSDFAATWNIAPDRVYQLSVGLDESADTLTVTDADGDRRDEVAFGDGSVTTSGGWYVDNVNEGDVANRSEADRFYLDNDTEFNWGVSPENSFFDVSPDPGVAFVDSGDSLASYSYTSGVTSYGVSSPVALGPATTDFDGNSEPDVPYVKNGNLRVVDGESTRNVDSSGNVVDANIAVGTFSQATSGTRIYYVKDPNGNGNTNQYDIYRGEPVGNNNQVTDDTQITPLGMAGIGDLDGDNDNELVYYAEDESIKFLDDGTNRADRVSTGYADVASRNATGTPAVFDSVRSSRALIPVVNSSGNINLIDNSGLVQSFDVSPAPEPSSLASYDVDSDPATEIVYVEQSAPNRLVALNVSDGTTAILTDQSDSEVESGDATTGTK
jgi:hypothetical protein